MKFLFSILMIILASSGQGTNQQSKMANKKKQEEENLRVLREMVALPHNKHCFDCNQRGPTYLNMTIGSFICTSCSGLLRGLNPPHRVKSISMASFTSEEMDFIKSRGNDFCKKVWLGLHDGRVLPESDLRDENKMRDLMCQKYEKKRWYVHATEELYEESRKQNASTSSSSSSKQSNVKPISTLVGPNLPALNVNPNQPPRTAAATQSIQRPNINPPPPSSSSSSGFVIQSSILSEPQSPTTTMTSTKASSLDILADMGTDPFSSQQHHLQQQQPNNGGFADFSAFTSLPASQANAQSAFRPPPGSIHQQLQPSQWQQHPQWTTTASGQGGGGGAGATPLMPQNSVPRPASVAAAANPQTPLAPGDRYSALAELESVFSTMHSSSSVNWDGGPIIGGGGGGGGGAAIFGPSAHNNSGFNASAFGGHGNVGTNVARHQQPHPTSMGVGVGGAPVVGMGHAGSGGSIPPPSYASLGLSSSVANPFGPSNNSMSSSSSSSATANPFMYSTAAGVGYGQPPGSGFNQFRPPQTGNAGFNNQFGGYMPPSGPPAAGQFGAVQNGGMGNIWGGGGGGMNPQQQQQTQVPQHQQQMMMNSGGGWGGDGMNQQQVPVNPFGSGAPARLSNVTNPFL